MKQIMAVAAAAILLGTAAAVAEVKQDESCWICRSPEDWEVASLRHGPKLILNNFFFEEKNSLRTKMQVLKVSYSTLNRTTKSYSMTGQFAGFDQAGSLLFAISASPDFDIPEPKLPRPTDLRSEGIDVSTVIEDFHRIQSSLARDYLAARCWPRCGDLSSSKMECRREPFPPWRR